MSDSIDLKIHNALLKRKETLSFAESCTGGYLATCLTRHSGASNYFAGSMVTYSNALKQKVLGVKAETLEAHGAVSEQTAKEMCQGLLALTNTDWGISITGIAGPMGGSAEKPVGTVYIAVAHKNSPPQVWRKQFEGERQAIIEASAQFALTQLYNQLQES